MKKFNSDIARAGGYTLPFMSIMPLLIAIAITIVWWVMVDKKCDIYMENNVSGSCWIMYLSAFVLMVLFWVGFYYSMRSITKPVWDAIEKMEKEESQNETKNNLK